MTWQQKLDLKLDLIQKGPVTCARKFEHMVQLFVKDVLKSNVMPIGEIVDFFYRVEFKQRRSPHIYALVGYLVAYESPLCCYTIIWSQFSRGYKRAFWQANHYQAVISH